MSKPYKSGSCVSTLEVVKQTLNFRGWENTRQYGGLDPKPEKIGSQPSPKPESVVNETPSFKEDVNPDLVYLLQTLNLKEDIGWQTLNPNGL